MVINRLINSMKIFYNILILSIINLTIYGQKLNRDQNFSPNIVSIQFNKAGKKLSYPILELNFDQQLELSFDDLTGGRNDFYYTIIHCDYNWDSSLLSFQEYAEGYEMNEIHDYYPSTNTSTNYSHYKLLIPNDELKIKLSGNYILKIYSDEEQKKLLFTRKFFVLENSSIIDAKAKRATYPEYKEKKQEIDFTVELYEKIIKPEESIKTIICQNYRWDNRITDLKPRFIDGKKLIYQYDKENIFEGGNEFRFFNCKNFKILMENIKNITYIAPYYNFELQQEKDKTYTPYNYLKDINGFFYIDDGTQNRNPDISADYVNVYFTLSYDIPYDNGNIYVFGALSDWNCTNKYKMNYNFDRKAYELTLFLKQGFYNYQYALLEKNKTIYDLVFIENSYYETENDYQIFIYDCSITNRYHRLIGYKLINTIEKL